MNSPISNLLPSWEEGLEPSPLCGRGEGEGIRKSSDSSIEQNLGRLEVPYELAVAPANDRGDMDEPTADRRLST